MNEYLNLGLTVSLGLICLHRFMIIKHVVNKNFSDIGVKMTAQIVKMTAEISMLKKRVEEVEINMATIDRHMWDNKPFKIKTFDPNLKEVK